MHRYKYLPIIGISPRNGYFNQENIGFVLDETLSRYGRTVIMVADIPNILNWRALGYERKVAERKARLDGNNYKNRVRLHCQKKGYTEAQVKILDWISDIEIHPAYRHYLDHVYALYDSNTDFKKSIRNATRDVIESAIRRERKFANRVQDIETAVDIARHYILAELAFFESAPEIYSVPGINFIYHRPFDVYEKYLSGQYEEEPKRSLGFNIIEAEHMTFRSLDIYRNLTEKWAQKIKLPGSILRVGFSPYPPGIYYDPVAQRYRGIFYDMLKTVADRQGLELRLVEETGYGVAVDALNKGRFDVFCSPTWNTPERESEALFSLPVYGSRVGIYIRQDHHLIQQDIKSLNSEDYVIAIKDRDVTEHYSQGYFDQARVVNNPQLAPIEDLLDRVEDGRATATFVEPALAEYYFKSGKYKSLKNIAVNAPLLVTPSHFMMAKDREDLVATLNAAFIRLQQEGVITQTMNHYLPNQDLYVPIGLSG